jgi:hypothetical protein
LGLFVFEVLPLAKKPPKKPEPDSTERLSSEELAEMRKNYKETGQLTKAQIDKLFLASSLLIQISLFLKNADATIAKLRHLLFGPKTEKDQPRTGGQPGGKKKTGRKGRNKSMDFPGADQVKCDHPELKEGDICPNCHQGQLEETDRRESVVFDGGPPFNITIFLLQTFVCSSCAKLFSAPLPEKMPEEARDLNKKEQPAAVSDPDDLGKRPPLRLYSIGFVLSLICERFIKAVPYYRLANVLKMLGIPLSPSTQYAILKSRCGELVLSVFEAMKVDAAQQGLFINDDTFFRILFYERTKKTGDPPKEGKSKKKKEEKYKKTKASAIIAQGEETYCLFQSSPENAGHFLNDLLNRRDSSLPAPLQMSDGSSANICEDHETVHGMCMDHARRKFYDVRESFPKHWEYIQPIIAEIYKADAEAKTKFQGDKDAKKKRLEWHQKKSLEAFETILNWCRSSIDPQAKQEAPTAKVEPNSTLGRAMKYFIYNEKYLRKFLEVEGMPIASIEVERLIKTIVLQRKNSLQFYSQNGADFGDAMSSIIATCRINEINPLNYLRILLENPRKVLAAPQKWLPRLVAAKLRDSSPKALPE